MKLEEKKYQLQLMSLNGRASTVSSGKIDTQYAAMSIPVALSTHDVWKFGRETRAGRLQGRVAPGAGRELNLADPRAATYHHAFPRASCPDSDVHLPQKNQLPSSRLAFH